MTVCKPPYTLHHHGYEVGRQFPEVHRGPPKEEMDKGVNNPAAGRELQSIRIVSLMVGPCITNQAL